jgi:hypothetical protein
MDLYLETFDLRAGMWRHHPAVGENANTLVHRSDQLGDMRADLTKVRQTCSIYSTTPASSPAGAISLDVTREVGDGLDWVTFCVSDTGIGMAPEQMAGCSSLRRPTPRPRASTAARAGAGDLHFCQMMVGTSPSSTLGKVYLSHQAARPGQRLKSAASAVC